MELYNQCARAAVKNACKQWHRQIDLVVTFVGDILLMPIRNTQREQTTKGNLASDTFFRSLKTFRLTFLRLQ